MIWYPEDVEWAEELVEECAAFPNGAHDDQVDSAVMAWMRFRQGNFIALADDEDDEPEVAENRYEYY
jgi:phage terminase large subunit-like protein